MLITKRLILSKVERNDLAFLMELRNDKLVREWICGSEVSMRDQESWFDSLTNEVIFVIHLKTGEPVGTVGLIEIIEQHKRAKWNLRVSPQYWRMGIAKEATKVFLEYVFGVLEINKLMGDCFTDNVAEINNLSGLGFNTEGLWKEHYFHNGRFRDSIQFVMLKRDYDFKKKYERT